MGEIGEIGGTRGTRAARSWKLAAWLTLVSFLCQLWITAGHFHPEDFAALRHVAKAGAITASADHGTQPLGALPHEDCSLCLSVQITGSATLTAATSPNEPAAHGTMKLCNYVPLLPSRSAYLLFQTRAPPIV